MGLLHPSDDDDAFALGHAQAGWNKAVRRCVKLRALLERARPTVTDKALATEIDAALARTFYDEPHDFPEPGWYKKA
jgi:hypothetical protein